MYWPFMMYIYWTANGARNRKICVWWRARTRGRNYATSSIYKLLFLQYFHLFSEMLAWYSHLMEKEMVVLCGKILCIWIICVSSYSFSLLHPLPLCAVLRYSPSLYLSRCQHNFFSTSFASLFCSCCRFCSLSVFIGLLDCSQKSTEK